MRHNLPAVLSKLPLPSMPTCERYARELTPQRKGDGGIVWERFTEVIPVQDCHRALRELEPALVPATQNVAKRLGALLIAAYPERAMVDADTYMQFIIATFSQFPHDIGVIAIDRLTLKLTFLPSRAELYAELFRLMDDRLYAQHECKRQLEEHAKRARKREQDKRDMWWCADQPKHWIPHRAQAMEISCPDLGSLVEAFGEEVDRWLDELTPEDRQDAKAALGRRAVEARKARLEAQCRELGVAVPQAQEDSP